MGAGIGNIAGYLSQSGGAADVAGAAGLGGLIPGLGALLALGFTIDDLVNGNYASLIDPFGIFGLQGVPKGAKTAGAAQSLEESGNPLSADLGKAISSFGGGKSSNVLSNPAFAHDTNTFADALTWLTGQALPGYKPMGSTGEIAGIKPPSGAPYSKDVNIMGVQSPAQLIAQLGKSPNLTPAQIKAILPQLQKIAGQPGMSVAGLKSALAPLITSAEKGGTAGTDINAYLNQTGGKPGSENPQVDVPQFPIPLLNFLNSGNNETQNNNTTNNLMAAFGLPGAALRQPQPTAARFAPLVLSPLPVA